MMKTLKIYKYQKQVKRVYFPLWVREGVLDMSLPFFLYNILLLER